MSKADKEKNIDDDILQCKEDILHAHNTKPQQTGIRTTAAEKPSKKEKPAVKETPKVQIEQISKKTETTGTAEAPQQKPEIPKFDLAEQILAEQRKITAARRRAPGQKITLMSKQAEQQQAANTTKASKPTHSYEDQIIAEIVAKDIERLHRGNN